MEGAGEQGGDSKRVSVMEGEYIFLFLFCPSQEHAIMHPTHSK